MYNDTTWMKSNRFGAVAMIAAGLLTIATSVFTKAGVALAMTIAYLLIATIITLIYSHKIYKQELSKEDRL